MLARILILLRTRLAAQKGDSTLPVAALLVQGTVAAVVCGLVRGEVPPFAYGLVALATCAALVAIPLLGELSRLLVADETGDWVRALPVRPIELHLARTAHLCLALAVLSLGALVPAALVAKGWDWSARVELVALGLGQSLAIAAALLLVQALLRGRAQGLLVLVQIVLFVGVLLGASLGLRKAPEMKTWVSPAAEAGLALFPPAWFAAPLGEAPPSALWSWVPLVATGIALVALVVTPAPQVRRFQKREAPLALALAPVRRLAVRFWVRASERASFEWLFDALPREREFVLRTYPLLAVPVAFVWISGRGEAAATQQDWLALLLFLPGAYLPLLAAHAPGSESFQARWILDTAPLERDALDAGAVKAIAARFLVPFYALLVGIGTLLGGGAMMLRLALPAFLCGVLVLRGTWRTFVVDPPLSIAPDSILVKQDWFGGLAVIAGVLSIVAVASSRLARGPLEALVLSLALLALERTLDRRSGVRLD